jgi:hypothetical protein
MAVNSSRWGTKIGPRIAMLVSQAIIHTHGKLAVLKHKVAMAVFHAISDEISDEVDVTLGPLIAKIHDSIDESHPAWSTVHFMHTQRGQLKAIAGTGLQMSGLLGSIATIMNNELAPSVYDVIRSNPHLVPTVTDATQMAVTGVISEGEVNGIANANGYDDGWAQAYLEVSRSYPTPDIGIEFLRRGEISSEGMNVLLQRAGIPAQYWGAMQSLRTIPVSVADAALAVLRGNLSSNQGAEIAAENGYSLDSFNILIGNTGEPPGTEQLLEAYRRGFIDKPTLERGIRQSRVRDEWIPVLEDLRYSPMSVADAVNAVVQNQLDQATAEQISVFNGLEPNDFDTLVKTAGEPLSRTEMSDLYNRGQATEDQVKQALRESRIKDKYVDLAFELHTRVIPLTTIDRALRYGDIDHAAAVQMVMDLGYSKDDAAIVVASGSGEKTQTYKDRVVSAVESMYEANIISEQQASSVIAAMGYTQEETTFILQASEFRRSAHITSSVVAALKTKYLSRHITRSQTIGYLDAIGIMASQRDSLMQIWDIEHGAYTRELTVAEIQKAVKDGLITPDDGMSRFVVMGYSEVDAKLLAEGA